jgi:hypothetical protein
MKPFANRIRKILAATVLAGVVSVATYWTGPLYGEQVVKNATWPVVVENQQTIDTATIPDNTPYEAIIRERASYKGMILPEGTVLRGVVTEAAPSRRLGRASYYRIQFSELQLPDGRLISFDADNPPKTYKIHHPDARTGWGAIAWNLPVNGTNAAVSIPVSAATNLGALPTLGISYGAASVVSIATEFIRKPRPLETRHGGVYKVAHGLYRVTPLYFIVTAIKKAPEADVAQGDLMTLYMPKKHLRQIFKATETVLNPGNAPQPVSLR